METVEQYLNRYAIHSDEVDGMVVPISVAMIAAQLVKQGDLEMKKPSWISLEEGQTEWILKKPQ